MTKCDIITGDCRTVLPSLPAESFGAVITDPPYGMAYQSAWRTDKAERFDPIANDDAPFVWWLPDAARLLRVGGCLLCFCRWDTAEAFRLAIGWAGLTIVSQIIWDREVHGMGDLKGEPGPRHDTIWFATKGAYAFPGKRPTTVVRHQRIGGEQLRHPNEKPLSLIIELVRDYAHPADAVLDPFLGSGTTAEACALLGRPFVGVEIDPKYAEQSRDRVRNAAPLWRAGA